MLKILNKKIIAWALYDWANSAYATVVLAGFFPIFFKSYWSSTSEVTESTFYLGLANSGSGIAIVILAPILGAIADASGMRKRFLMVFTLIGVCMTATMSTIGANETLMAIMVYMFASIGFLGSMVFYDALLIVVSDEENYNIVSAFGYALGYLGGGLLFMGTVALTIWPEFFGLADKVAAVKVAFIFVAVWWFIFALPVMFLVPEKKRNNKNSMRESIGRAFTQLSDTFRHIRSLRIVFLFLLAYWLYIDGVDTVVVMAADYGAALGFSAENLITALLITQFIGFPAAIVFGILGEKYGVKKAVITGIGVYLIVTVWAYWMDTIYEFYAMAITIGLVQGGVQSLSRSIYASMIPADKSAEFFGFYNMVGKFAAILGPFLVAIVAKTSGDSRLAILSIGMLFIAGGILLFFVDVEEGKKMSKSVN